MRTYAGEGVQFRRFRDLFICLNVSMGIITILFANVDAAKWLELGYVQLLGVEVRIKSLLGMRQTDLIEGHFAFWIPTMALSLALWLILRAATRNNKAARAAIPIVVGVAIFLMPTLIWLFWSSPRYYAPTELAFLGVVGGGAHGDLGPLAPSWKDPASCFGANCNLVPPSQHRRACRILWAGWTNPRIPCVGRMDLGLGAALGAKSHQSSALMGALSQIERVEFDRIHGCFADDLDGCTDVRHCRYQRDHQRQWIRRDARDRAGLDWHGARRGAKLERDADCGAGGCGIEVRGGAGAEQRNRV
jgi:hypothetical protein